MYKTVDRHYVQASLKGFKGPVIYRSDSKCRKVVVINKLLELSISIDKQIALKVIHNLYFVYVFVLSDNSKPKVF